MGTAVYKAAGNRNAAVLRTVAGSRGRCEYPDPQRHQRAAHCRVAKPGCDRNAAGRGANLEARDGWGKTPLHHAAEFSGTGPEVRALLAAGANIEARDEDGNTPLHLAAEYQFFPEATNQERNSIAEEAIEALLEGGANPNARNAAGRTPWDLAQENDRLRDSDAYWRLNDARYNTAPQGSRRPVSTPRGQRLAGAVSRESLERACEIPGLSKSNECAGCRGGVVQLDRRLPASSLRAAGGRGMVRDCPRHVLVGGAGQRSPPGDQRGLRCARCARSGRRPTLQLSRRLQALNGLAESRLDGCGR